VGAASQVTRARELSRSITLETAHLLDRALRLAETVDLADHDRAARETAALGLEIAALDRGWHRAMDALQSDMRRFVEQQVAASPDGASDFASVDLRLADPGDRDAGFAGRTPGFAGGTPELARERAGRTRELALWDAPQVTLDARKVGEQVVVWLLGGPSVVGTRWQAHGPLDTLDARTIVWTPSGADDRLAVAVRSEGGVAILALGASAVRDTT
jgi:hypothetical protein